MDVLFPFGYGMSYSTFSYGLMSVDTEKMRDDETVEVSINVINESMVPGKEVVQLYVEADIPNTKVRRPVRELRAFTKVYLEAHERRTVTFILDKSAFAYYDTDISDWYVEPGDYKIEICKNADEVIAEKTVNVVPKKPKKPVYDENSVYKDIMENPSSAKIAKPYFEKYLFKDPDEDSTDEVATEAFGSDPEIFLRDTTLRNVVNMSFGKVTYEDMRQLIDKLNK